MSLPVPARSTPGQSRPYRGLGQQISKYTCQSLSWHKQIVPVAFPSLHPSATKLMHCMPAGPSDSIIHSLCVQYSCCCYHLHPFACMPHQVWKKHYVLTDQRPDSVRRKKPENRVSTLTGITQKKEAKEMPTTNAKKKNEETYNHVSTKQSRAEQGRRGRSTGKAEQEKKKKHKVVHMDDDPRFLLYLQQRMCENRQGRDRETRDI